MRIMVLVLVCLIAQPSLVGGRKRKMAKKNVLSKRQQKMANRRYKKYVPCGGKCCQKKGMQQKEKFDQQEKEKRVHFAEKVKHCEIPQYPLPPEMSDVPPMDEICENVSVVAIATPVTLIVMLYLLTAFGCIEIE